MPSLLVTTEEWLPLHEGWPGTASRGGCRERAEPASDCSVPSQGLVSSRHRLVMCQLAVQNSDWIR